MISRSRGARLGATLLHIHRVRYLSKAPRPPRNTFVPILNPLQLIWHTHVPTGIKFAGALGSVASILTHVHPNILVTIGPPTLMGGYYAYRYFRQKYRIQEISQVLASLPDANGDDVIRIQAYDESAIENVIIGLETQFDHFKSQIIELVERRIVDYVGSEPQPQGVLRRFIDENLQFNVHMNADELETFILLQTPDESKFVKLSLPFYSSKDFARRERLGTCEVYLVELKETSTYVEYRIRISVSPYKFFARKETQVINACKGGIMSSSLLKPETTIN